MPIGTIERNDYQDQWEKNDHADPSSQYGCPVIAKTIIRAGPAQKWNPVLDAERGVDGFIVNKMFLLRCKLLVKSSCFLVGHDRLG